MNDEAKNLSAETAYVAIHYVMELQQKEPNGVIRVRARTTYLSSRRERLQAVQSCRSLTE